VKEPYLPVDIEQRVVKATEFKSDNADRYQYKGKYAQRRFMSELRFEKGLTNEQYLKLLSDIKAKNNEVIIAPYFSLETEEKVQLSNVFYVKLKNISDVVLLEQIAEQFNCTIIMQNETRPLWFTLSVTEKSELNALEYATYFYECGLFEVAEPDLMADLIKLE